MAKLSTASQIAEILDFDGRSVAEALRTIEGGYIRVVDDYGVRGQIPQSQRVPGRTVLVLSDQRIFWIDPNPDAPKDDDGWSVPFWVRPITQGSLQQRNNRIGGYAGWPIKGMRFLETHVEKDGVITPRFPHVQWEFRLAGEPSGVFADSPALTQDDWVVIPQAADLMKISLSSVRARTLSSAAAAMVMISAAVTGIVPDRFEAEWSGYKTSFKSLPFTTPDYAKPEGIIGIGDSMLEAKWLEGAVAGLGVPLKNVAKFSSGAKQAYRLGTRPLYFTAQGNTIPASGVPVSVTFINGVAPGAPTSFDMFAPHGFLNTDADDTVATHCSETGTWGGRHGVVSVPNGGTPVYTFVPDDGLGATPVDPQAIFVPDNLDLLSRYEIVIRLSQNYAFVGPGNPAFPHDINPRVIEDIQLILDRRQGQRATVLCLTADNAMTTGTPYYTALRYINAQFEALWPNITARVTVGGQTYNNFQYIREFGRDGSDNDKADYDAGIMPRSCMADGLHHNTKGQGLERQFWELWRQQQRVPPPLPVGTPYQLTAFGTLPVTGEVVSHKVSGVVAKGGDAFDDTARKGVSTVMSSLSTWPSVAGDAIVSGSFVRYDTGAVTANAAYNYQAFPVAAGARVRVSAAISGDQTALAVFLKADGQYVGYAERAPSGSTAVYTDFELTVPNGAERLVISQGIVRNGTNPMAVKVQTLEASVPAKITQAQATADAAGTKAAAAMASLTGLTSVTGTLHTGEFVNYNTGVPAANASYSWKQFPISGGQVLRVSASVIGATTALAVFRDAAGAFISYVNRGGSGSATVYTDYEITAPANAASVILCQQTNYDASNPMTVKVVTVETSVPTKLAAAQNAADDANLKATNAANALTSFEALAGTTHAGEFVTYNTGVAAANTSYSWKEIPVSAGDVLRLTATVVGTSTALAVFKDGSGNFLSYVNRGTSGSSAVYTDYEVTAPAGAAVVILCQQNNFNSTTPMTAKRRTFASGIAGDVSALKGATQGLQTSITANAADITTLKDGSAKNTAAVSDFAAVVGGAIVAGSYIDRADGVAKALSGYSYQSWDVTPGELLRLSGRISGGTTALAYWYSSSGAYLGYSNGAPSGSGQTYADELIQVPANAVKLSMSQPTSNQAATPMTVKRGARIFTLPARVKALEEGGGNSYWKGKTVAWYGNSIPTGGTPGSYPVQLAEALGFTLYRETTGGMAFRAGVRSLVSGSDPYGWNGRSWTGLMWSLGMNLTEKQYLIDNWSTLRSMLSNSPPETLTTSNINNALACSYENRLVANHLGANRRDWYIFDNPFNDRAMADDLTTAGVGGEDRMTYLGTMNLLIRLILEDNPAANIAMIGHYENQRYPSLVAAQKMVTDLWSIPNLALHEKLGWSQRQITVNGSWVADGSGLYTWTAGTGSQTMTVLNRRLPDGTHPSVDASGAPVRETTNAILPWMRDLR